MEISLYEIFPISGDWDKLGIPNLTRMSLIKSYWILQNVRDTAFTISELLRENQGGGGGRQKIPPTPTQIKFGVVGTALMDLSKVYDCLLHGLLLVKLSAYGFDESAIALMASYLSDRYQHVKIRSTFTCYLKILRGVPQGSILGPILFKLFMNDLMFFIQETEVCNFASEITIYSCLPNFEEGTLRLSNDMHLILNWFKINIMVANSGKSQMFLGSNIDNSKITFMKSPPRL